MEKEECYSTYLTLNYAFCHLGAFDIIFFLSRKKGNTLNSDNEAKSEYETELERLRAEVASLKSDLATCQSQSVFSDDFDPVL